MTTNNNIYKPTRLKVNRLGIDISNDTNDSLDLSGTEYLVVGEQSTGIVTNNVKSYSLIVDNEGIAINSSRETRSTLGRLGNLSLEVYGQTYIDGSLNIKGSIHFLDVNGNIETTIGSGTTIGTGTTGTTIGSFWKPASNATGATAIHYAGNISLGSFEHSSSNPYKINVMDIASTIDSAQFAIQNKSDGLFRIGIIGTESNSPVIFNTLNKSPIQFHVGRALTDLPPNLTIDENGNVGIHKTLNEDMHFKKLVKVGINTDTPIFGDFKEKPVLHAEGTSYFKDILMFDYETYLPKHLDELYVRRLGITFEASSIIPGIFEPGPFTFTSNLYITNPSYSDIANDRIKDEDPNTLLYVNGDIHTPCNVIVDGTLTANLAILTDNVSFSNNVYVQNNVYFKGALFKQRGNELDEQGEPIYDMLQFGTSSFTRNNNGIMTANYTKVKDYTEDSASEWIRQTIPDDANNQWRSVIWAPDVNNTEPKGLFVAVSSTGEGNRVITSTDGINWTLQTSAADYEWNSVTWSPELSLFVAVASSGIGERVMTSSDGIEWKLQKSAADNDWRSVIWAPDVNNTEPKGLFVAVASSGTDNRVMTSVDGINWELRTSVANNDWQSITWSPTLKLFVAVSNTGTIVPPIDEDVPANPNLENRVMTSKDGIEWDIQSAYNNNWTSVIWADGIGDDDNGLFVAVSSSGINHRVMISNDGEQWTQQESPTNNWTSVVFANKSVTAIVDDVQVTTNEYLLVAVSWTGEGNRVMTSRDGKVWVIQKSIFDYNWSSIAWSPELDLFVAVSISNSITNIYPLGEGFGTPGRGVFGLDPNNILDADENNHQVVIIKRDLTRFELELTDKSDKFYKRSAFIGHPKVSDSNIDDGSLVFLTSEQKYGGPDNLLYKKKSQNFYFYPKGNNLPDIDTGTTLTINPANFVIEAINPPTLGIFPKKIGINTFNPKQEVHVEGNIYVSGKYYYKRNANDNDGSEIGFWNAHTNLGISYTNPLAPYVGINENPSKDYSLTVRGNIRSDGFYTRAGNKIAHFYDSATFTNILNIPYTNVVTNGRMGIGVIPNNSTLHIKDSLNNTSLKLSQGNVSENISLMFNGDVVDYSWVLSSDTKIFELDYHNHTDLSYNSDIKPFVTRYINGRHQIVINSNIGLADARDNDTLLVNGSMYVEGNINVKGNINVTGLYQINSKTITIDAINSTPNDGFYINDASSNNIYIIGSDVYIDPEKTLYIGLRTGTHDDEAILHVKNKHATSIFAASYNTSADACMNKYTTSNDKSVIVGLTDTNKFFVGKSQSEPYITVVNSNSVNSVGIGPVTNPDGSSLNVISVSATQPLAKFTRRLNAGGDEPADISLEKIVNTTTSSWKLQGPNSTYNQKLQFVYEEHDSSNSISTSNEVLCITKDGLIGIGTPTPKFAIDIQNMGENGSIRMLQEPFMQKDSSNTQANPFFINNTTIQISNDWQITTGWQVLASSATENAYKAFDNDEDNTSSYESAEVFDNTSDDNVVNIGLSYPYPVILKSITFANITEISRLPHNWEVQYSSDNVDWELQETFENHAWETTPTQTISLDQSRLTVPYKYWRINVTKIGAGEKSLLINSLIFNTIPIVTARPQMIFQTGLDELGNDIYNDYCLYASDNSFTIDSRNTTDPKKMLLNFNSIGNVGIRTSANDEYNVSINGSLNVSDNIYIQGRSFFNTRVPSDENMMAFITWDNISILPTINSNMYGGVVINGRESTSNVFQVNSGNNGNVAVFNSTLKKSYVHLRSTDTDTGIIWRYGLNMENSNAYINEFKISNENIPEFIDDSSTDYIRANELTIIKEPNSNTITKDLLQTTYGSISIKKFNSNIESGNGHVEGNFEVKGYLINDSDRRIKNNIQPIENALEKIKKLSGYTFNKNNIAKRETGVIAQEVAEVLPEAVFETKDGILGVAYGNLAGIIIEAIKDLSKEIEEIKRKL